MNKPDTKATHSVAPFILNIQTRQSDGGRKEICGFRGVEEEGNGK